MLVTKKTKKTKCSSAVYFVSSSTILFLPPLSIAMTEVTSYTGQFLGLVHCVTQSTRTLSPWSRMDPSTSSFPSTPLVQQGPIPPPSRYECNKTPDGLPAPSRLLFPPEKRRHQHLNLVCDHVRDPKHLCSQRYSARVPNQLVEY